MGKYISNLMRQIDHLLTLGRRLSEAQVENMFKRQMGDESDKNSDM